MERCGTVLRVERHQHLSTRLMGLAVDTKRGKRWRCYIDGVQGGVRCVHGLWGLQPGSCGEHRRLNRDTCRSKTHSEDHAIHEGQCC